MSVTVIEITENKKTDKKQENKLSLKDRIVKIAILLSSSDEKEIEKGKVLRKKLFEEMKKIFEKDFQEVVADAKTEFLKLVLGQGNKSCIKTLFNISKLELQIAQIKYDVIKNNIKQEEV